MRFRKTCQFRDFWEDIADSFFQTTITGFLTINDIMPSTYFYIMKSNNANRKTNYSFSLFHKIFSSESSKQNYSKDQVLYWLNQLNEIAIQEMGEDISQKFQKVRDALN